jgi:two-component system LytT family response regulator
MPIGELAERLDASRLVRVQRSEIVNVDHVVSVASRAHGDAILRLRDGAEVLASRRFRASWLTRLRGVTSNERT